MSKYDMSSVLNKAKAAISRGGSAYERFQREAGKMIGGGARLEIESVGSALAAEAAETFIKVLEGCMRVSLGSSAAGALSGLAATTPQNLGDGKYSVTVYWVGDLTRPSLVPERYGGVKDLAELFDKGYSATHGVHGSWKGADQWSRKSRPATGFMDEAVAEFLGKYSAKYNVISCTKG